MSPRPDRNPSVWSPGPPPAPPERLEAYGGSLPIAWHPTGAFRISVGWFGRLTLEMQEAASPGVIKAVYRWRRAPRGTLVMLHNLPQPRN